MPGGELDAHLRKCKAALAVAATAVGTRPSIKSDAGSTGEVADDIVSSRLPDGRVRCQFCGRGFHSDRVGAHSVICGKLKQARPRGPDGKPTQEPPKVYSAAQAGFVSKQEAQHDEEPPSAAHQKPKTTASPQRPRAKSMSDHQSTTPLSCRAGRTASPEKKRASWRSRHGELIARIRDARREAKNGPDFEVLTPQAKSSEGDVTLHSSLESPFLLKPELSDTSSDRNKRPAHRHSTDPTSVGGKSVDSRQSSTPVKRSISVCSSAVTTAPPSPFHPSSSRKPVPRQSTPVYPEAGELQAGSQVRLRRLVGAAHLNGRFAVLKYFDKDADCWLADLDDGEVRALRAEHVELQPDSQEEMELDEPYAATPDSSMPTPTRRPPLATRVTTPLLKDSQCSRSQRGPSPPLSARTPGKPNETRPQGEVPQRARRAASAEVLPRHGAASVPTVTGRHRPSVEMRLTSACGSKNPLASASTSQCKIATSSCTTPQLVWAPVSSSVQHLQQQQQQQVMQQHMLTHSITTPQVEHVLPDGKFVHNPYLLRCADPHSGLQVVTPNRTWVSSFVQRTAAAAPAASATAAAV